MVESSDQKRLLDFLNSWLINKINIDLESLLKLKSINVPDPQIRALAFQIYENNGVIKREDVLDLVRGLSQDQRKILRDVGVKFGRYHIFLYKLFKPQAVSLRILLWKNYHGKFFSLNPPTFGLNFIEDKSKINQNFMLLCGFEKFDRFFVRIDILERLFMHIINSNSKNQNEIKIVPEMLNLLGCNKENFLKLIRLMNYKSFEKNKETYLKYMPKKNVFKSKPKKNFDNPFNILNQLNIK